MTPYSCVIIDDEFRAVELLQHYAAQDAALQVRNTFTKPAAALEWLRQNPCDILLLDVQMPGLSGIQLLQQLEKKPVVIFTTANPAYALQAFELEVMDYLLKPIAPERFSKAIEKAKEYIGYTRKQAPVADALFVKADYKMQKILLTDIVYIESASEYVKLYTGAKTIMTLEALRNLETLLPTAGFCRIHKSYIVSRQALLSWSATEAVLNNHKKLPVGRTYKEGFLRWVGV
jgi:DNA-binding LytR/AlgR family response regulator